MVNGRPSKFTPENRKKILDAIAQGAPYKISCEMNGVSDSTFHSWVNQGIKDIDEGIESEFANFLGSLRKIEFDRITSNLNEIRSSDKSHRGCEWELERSFWRHFSSHAQNIELNERVENLEKSKEQK